VHFRDVFYRRRLSLGRQVKARKTPGESKTKSETRHVNRKGNERFLTEAITYGGAARCALRAFLADGFIFSLTPFQYFPFICLCFSHFSRLSLPPPSLPIFIRLPRLILTRRVVPLPRRASKLNSTRTPVHPETDIQYALFATQSLVPGHFRPGVLPLRWTFFRLSSVFRPSYVMHISPSLRISINQIPGGSVMGCSRAMACVYQRALETWEEKWRNKRWTISRSVRKSSSKVFNKPLQRHSKMRRDSLGLIPPRAEGVLVKSNFNIGRARARARARSSRSRGPLT